MADAAVYENQEFKILLDTGQDLTAETGSNAKVLRRNPSGTEEEKTGVIESPATDGIISYTNAVDELTPVGAWEFQTYLATQQTPGRVYTVDVISKTEKDDIPSVIEIRNELEGYGINSSVISNRWIVNFRDKFVMPYIERKTRQTFSEVSTATEYKSGNGGSILILNRRPIVELVSLSYTNFVEVDQFTINVNSIQVIADEGILKARYDFREDNWRPIFSRGINNIRVEYTYGATAIPEATGLREAVIYMTAERVLGQIEGRTGGGDLSVPGISKSYGNRGKYTNARNDLARLALTILRDNMTGVIGS